MKRLLFFAFFGALLNISLTTNAQNVAGTAVNARDNNPYKKYMRPSLTVLFIQRNDSRSERMMKIIEKADMPSKFNDNNIANKRITGFSPSSFSFTTDLEHYLSTDVSRQVIAKWFNRNAKGEFNMDIIAERGLYNASDADVMKAQASQRKMALLQDAGENLLDRSYILVYDIYNIKTAREARLSSLSGSELEGYVCNFDCYLYRLDWNDSIASVFYNTLWNDASAPNTEKVNAFDKAAFPVKFIAQTSSPFGEIQSTQNADHSLIYGDVLTDDELFANLYEEVVKVANLSLAQKNEDFRVKAPVLYTGPIAAKIGKKEGLTVDKRFFAYEMQIGKNGKRKAVRKGVVRATSTISDNRRMASGQSDTSTFYQVAGWGISEGMQLQENPDWGFGFMLSWGNLPGVQNGLNATLEINASMWSDKALSTALGSSVPPGIKIYANGNITGNSITLNSGAGEFNIISWTAGISKDLNFLHHFVLVPFIGYGQEQYKNISNTDDVYNSNFIQLGGRLGMNVVHNIQIMANFSLNSVLLATPHKDNPNYDTQAGTDIGTEIRNKRGTQPQMSIGLRYQF